MIPSPRLAGLFVYPVKSTAGLAVGDAGVETRGLTGDRRWMVTDGGGDFLSGREFPKLVLIRAAPAGGGIVLSAPGMPDLQVPTPDGVGPRVDVTVWEDTLAALPAGADADAWVSEFLHTDGRLAFMDSACARELRGFRGLAADQVSFADNYPLLGVSRASLDDLSRRIGEPMDVRRFRPNLIFDGCEAYAEDRWRRLRIGQVEFDGAERCSRCAFTIIDPDTASAHPAQEPLRTLGRYRRGNDGAVYFGLNLIPRGGGRIRVGDEINVLRS
ncbi:MAG: MOSC domain-containing protein [Gammaproteobacteria bacterium]|nr:MOSC domain-containing protein [Gammaproteobacteria bacterium]